MAITENCPVHAHFFGVMGAAASTVFACLGAGYGTAKSGVGVAAASVLRPDQIFKYIVPVIFAGILGIYGLMVSIIILARITADEYTLLLSFMHLGAGLCCGMGSLAAGMAIGIVGDAGVRASAQQPRMYVGVVLILIFCEVLALYGVIVGVVMAGHDAGKC